MMKFLRRAAIVTTAIASPLFAANVVHAHGTGSCDEILASGTMAITDVYSSTLLTRIFYERVRKSTFENFSKNQSAAAQFKAYFGRFDEQKFRSVQAALNRVTFTDASEYTELDFFKSSGDEKVISAWLECKKKRHGVSIVPEALSPTEVRISLTYHKGNFSAADPVALIARDIVVPGKVIKGSECLMKDYELLPEGCVVELRVDGPLVSVTASLETNQGSDSAYLPSRTDIRWQQKSIGIGPQIVKDVPKGTDRKVRQLLAFSLSNDLRSKGWRIIPGTQYLVVKRAGDGRCEERQPQIWLGTEQVPDPENFFQVAADVRVDRNPGDGPLVCEYTLGTDIGRFFDFNKR